MSWNFEEKGGDKLLPVWCRPSVNCFLFTLLREAGNSFQESHRKENVLIIMCFSKFFFFIS